MKLLNGIARLSNKFLNPYGMNLWSTLAIAWLFWRHLGRSVCGAIWRGVGFAI
jgi:hypothetical protein